MNPGAVDFGNESKKSPLDRRPILFVRHILVRHADGRRRILTVNANDPAVLELMVRNRVADLPEGWRVAY